MKAGHAFPHQETHSDKVANHDTYGYCTLQVSYNYTNPPDLPAKSHEEENIPSLQVVAYRILNSSFEIYIWIKRY